MNTGDILQGFTVKYVRQIPDISATMYIMEHIKTAARLIYLDREDRNMTFAIGFKTLPEDSSGVFHILEHSVLCGSRKFPIKEPFTELLKGSLKTFLNALTYADMTVYPVSSRNKKDLLNLAQVYLDAVFFPLAVENENIFKQEGHRFEFDGEGEACINGVVYNEMKGAYSSPDEISATLLDELLFPNSPYSHDSGGNPSEIPNLTYEKFKETHKKFYHPSNSYTLIDGSADLCALLKLIDSYFSQFERREINFTINTDTPVNTEVRFEEYAKGEGDEKDKTRLYLGYRTSHFSNVQNSLALSVLTDALASCNDAPLRKAVLASGLCDSFSLSVYDGYTEGVLCAKFKGVKDGKEEKLISAYRTALADIIKNGIPKDLIESSISLCEFREREKDFGSYPLGVVYAISIFDSWIKGGDPWQNLETSAHFDSLREKLNSRFFENLLEDAVSSPEARLFLTASGTLNEKREKALAKQLKKELSQLSAEELSRLVKEHKDFDIWQNTADSEEALATIPHLSKEDIGDAPDPIPTVNYTEDGVTVISHPISTSGITYAELFFDCSDVSHEDLYKLLLFTMLFGDVSTESGEPIIINSRVKRELGSLSVSLAPIRMRGEVKLYIKVTLSLLNSKKNRLPDILREYLLTADFSDTAPLSRKLSQIRLVFDDMLTSRGSTYATSRVGAMFDTLEALYEYHGGYEALKSIRYADDHKDEVLNSISSYFCDTARRVFKKERLIFSYTGESDNEFVKSVISVFEASGKTPGACKVPLLCKRNEGIAVPSRVAFAAVGAHFESCGIADIGRFAVLSNILDYNLLWNEVRVKGGAYDTSFTYSHSGKLITMYSFNDPSPENSTEVFLSLPDLIRNFANEDSDLTDYIIGAVGESDPLMTPKRQGALATKYFLVGRTDEELKQIREEMLSFSKETLLSLADRIEEALKTARVAVIAPKHKLEGIKRLDIIE